MPTGSNSLVLITGQSQIDVINTENTIIITLDFKISLIVISLLIKRLKSLEKLLN
jgi:hypothetical protein